MSAPPKGENSELHIPSPFFNRGPGGNENPFNYGRMEYDILHHVSSAVHAFAAELDWDLAFGHINAARRRLDALEALIRSSKASCRSVERSGHTTTPGV